MTMTFGTNVFISHASNFSGMTAARMLQMLRQVESYAANLLAREVRDAVQKYQAKQNWQTAEWCFAAYRKLQGLSDEDWDAIEPKLFDEIGVLHDLCATDEDLQ
jgi:hypothetical protein